MIRTYSDLIKLSTFEERFKYLKLDGKVGVETFGYERYLNQVFYRRDPEWKAVRQAVIIRDNGCDLGIDGLVIPGRIIVHHLNPLTEEDIRYRTPNLLDPEFLICVTDETHRAIHYGDIEYGKVFDLVERRPNDTCPWKR